MSCLKNSRRNPLRLMKLLGASSLAATLALATCLPSQALAGKFKNEPVDFRGVAWGSAVEQHASELRQVRKDDDVLVYVRNGEKMSMGQAEILKIAYRYFKDKFSAGIIQIYGGANKRYLRDALIDAYGEPVRLSKRQELDTWDGETVQIVLACSVTSYCVAEFISKQMIAWEEAETGHPVQSLSPDSDDD